MNHTVLSAWIDAFDENNNKETVFHECYINVFGDINISDLQSIEILCLERSLEMCLLLAFRHNAIITSDGLAPSEFIHVCNGKAYYEDGGCLGTHSEASEFLNSQEWARNHKWFILRYLPDDKVEEIKKLRTNPRVYESAWYEKELNKILN